jgi:hypothetical protein
LAKDQTYHVSNFASAIYLISKLSILYSKLDDQKKRELLRQVIKRIIINNAGEIVEMELHSLFTYLQKGATQIENGSGYKKQLTSKRLTVHFQTH